jgi:MFS family permease
MQVIPERLRGRTFALLRMLMQSGSPLGGVLAGWLLPAFGLPAVIALSALITGLPALAGLRTRALLEAAPGGQSTRHSQPDLSPAPLAEHDTRD